MDTPLVQSEKTPIPVALSTLIENRLSMGLFPLNKLDTPLVQSENVPLMLVLDLIDAIRRWFNQHELDDRRSVG